MKTVSEQSLERINSLKKTNAELQCTVEILTQEIQAKEAKIQRLMEEFRLAQHQRFGRISEAHPNQGGGAL